MSGNNEKSWDELKKSARELDTQAQKTAQAVRREVRQESSDLNKWADRTGKNLSDAADTVVKKSNSAEKIIEDGYHKLSKDVKHAAKNISNKLKK